MSFCIPWENALHIDGNGNGHWLYGTKVDQGFVQENSYMLRPMWLYLLLVFMVFVNFIFWDRWRHALKCQCVQCKVGIYLVNSFDSMWWRCVHVERIVCFLLNLICTTSTLSHSKSRAMQIDWMVKYFDPKDLTNLKCPWCTKSYRRLYAYFVFSMYLVAMFRDISPETCSPFGARQPGTSSLILDVSHSWRSTKEKKTSWCSAVYKRWMQVVSNTSQPEQMNVSTFKTQI